MTEGCVRRRMLPISRTTSALRAGRSTAAPARRLTSEWKSSGNGVHGSPQEWKHGHQVLVWFDGLGSGLPVGHEDHAGGEDVVGHDPAVGVVGRHGAVVVQDIGEQSEAAALASSGA